MCQELENFNLLSADVEGRQNREFWLLRSYPLKMIDFQNLSKFHFWRLLVQNWMPKSNSATIFSLEPCFLGHFEKFFKNRVFGLSKVSRGVSRKLRKIRFSRLSLLDMFLGQFWLQKTIKAARNCLNPSRAS